MIRIRSGIINIIASLCIFLVFVVVVELVLRTTHLFGARLSWSEPDPILGYRFIPSSDYWYYKENDHPITGRINSYGWKDKEWALKKPQNTYRIAVLGDSIVEAFQVESDRTCLSLAEHELNENHKLKFEFMNFGLSGFTQTEEFWVLKNHVMQFSPDMVIVFFQPLNDIMDVEKETASGLIRPFYHISGNEELILDTSFVKTREFKNKLLVNRLKKHSVLISLLCERYSYYQQIQWLEKNEKLKNKNAGAKVLQRNKLDGYLTLCTANPDSTYLKNYQLNKMLIKAMSEYCKGEGLKFILVTIDNDYIPKSEEKHKAIDPTFDANYFEDDLKNYATILNIEYLGLQRIFRQAYENNGIPLHWGHWNYQGHKLVANVLADKLKSVVLFEK